MLAVAYVRADLSTKTDTFVAVGPRNLNEHRYGRVSRKRESRLLTCMPSHRDGGGQTSLAAFRVRKPTICAINGHAVGIGEYLSSGRQLVERRFLARLLTDGALHLTYHTCLGIH